MIISNWYHPFVLGHKKFWLGWKELQFQKETLSLSSWSESPYKQEATILTTAEQGANLSSPG